MSAAASISSPSPPPAGRAYVAERGFCRTPRSCLIGTGDLSPTAKICLLLIVDSTIGWSGRPWMAIPLSEFALTTRRSQDHCRSAITELEQLKWIVKRVRADGTVEYSPSPKLWFEANSRDGARGECGRCGAVTSAYTYSPSPHSLVRKLAPCCDHAAYAVTLVVAEACLRWDDAAKCAYVEESDISTEQFCQGSGLEERQAQAGIREALRLGVIWCDNRPGRVQRYKLIPEQFDKLKLRNLRRVNQPKDRAVKGEEKKKKVTTIEPEPTETIEEPPAIESVVFFHGRCQVCRQFCGFSKVSSDVGDGFTSTRLRFPSPPGDEARAVPRASPPSASKSTKVGTVSPELSAWLTGLKFRQLPDYLVKKEIAQALAPLALAALIAACAPRLEYLGKIDYPYKAIGRIAADLPRSTPEEIQRIERENDRARRIRLEQEAENREFLRRELALADTDEKRELVFAACPELREESR